MIGQQQLSRRQMIRALGAVAAVGMVGRFTWAADDAPVEEPLRPFGFDGAAQTMDLGSGLAMIAGVGGNITVVNAGAGSFLIDSGVPQRADDVVKAVTAAAGGKLPSTLINTHYHFDHAGGNGALAAAGVKSIIAHDRTLARVSATQHNSFLNMDFPPIEPPARPTKTFKDTLDYREADAPKAQLVHVDPAHTDGDIYVRFPDANVLVTGDLFFNGRYPFIDYDAKGSLDGMIAAVKKLLTVADAKTKIVPGHGDLATRPDLEAFGEMLTTVRDRLTALAKQGVSLQEAQKRRPLADLDPKWGQWAFHGSNFIRLVYGGLKKD